MKADLAMAIREHRRGRLERAQRLYRKILSRQPGNADALHFLGVLLHQQGESDQAVRMIDRALRARPDYVDAHKNLGNVYLEAGQPDKAEACYRRALELDPVDADAWNNLCVALKSQQRFSEAAEAGSRAVSLHPQHLNAWFNLGNALKYSGQFDGAVNAYRRVIAVNRGFIPAHVELCHLLYRLERLSGPAEGFLKERIEAYRDWIALDADNPVPKFMLAACEGQTASRAPDAFVRQLFDGFANSFDQNLASLDYRVPRLVADRLPEAREGSLDVLDAGCGTGLCGPFLRPLARRLVGVDLSGGMLQKAVARRLYDELIEAELSAFLAAQSACFDIIVSADTIIYFGDLTAVIAGAAQALRPGGRLIFSLERLPEEAADGVVLTSSGRFAHSERYVRDVLVDAGMHVEACDHEVLRKESGQPIHGLLLDARKPVLADA